MINVNLNEKEPGHFFGTKAVLHSFFIYYNRLVTYLEEYIGFEN